MLLIGSVKSNLGHMEAAAGIGGLIKAALVVRHRTIPPSLHYERPNPHIPFDELRFASSTRCGRGRRPRARPWPGVSSFGFGGTNAHLVLQEAPAPVPAPEPAPRRRPAVALTISARATEALRELAGRYEALLAEPGAGHAGSPVRGRGVAPDAPRAPARLRRRFRHRVAPTRSPPSAPARSGRGCRGAAGGWGVAPSRCSSSPGRGRSWWPIAADLLATEPVFREVLERCDAALRAATSTGRCSTSSRRPAGPG